MKKILPIKKPYISSYPGVANYLGILQSYPQTEEWIFQNFIQVVYYENINRQYLHEMTGSLLDLESGLWLIGQHSYCPFFIQYLLDRKLLHLFCNDIVCSFKEVINNNYYINLYLNHKMIKNSMFFQNEDHDNPVMIYGYDDYTEEFLVAGYFKNNRHDFHRITYQDFMAAEMNIKSSNDYSNYYIQRIQFLKIRTDVNVKFDKSEMLLFFKDYLESMVWETIDITGLFNLKIGFFKLVLRISFYPN